MIFDAEDNEKKFEVSLLDWERLKSMDVSESVEAENSTWKVICYKNCYTLITFYPKSDMKDFKTWRELVQYLK